MYIQHTSKTSCWNFFIWLFIICILCPTLISMGVFATAYPYVLSMSGWRKWTCHLWASAKIRSNNFINGNNLVVDRQEEPHTLVPACSKVSALRHVQSKGDALNLISNFAALSWNFGFCSFSCCTLASNWSDQAAPCAENTTPWHLLLLTDHSSLTWATTHSTHLKPRPDQWCWEVVYGAGCSLVCGGKYFSLLDILYVGWALMLVSGAKEHQHLFLLVVGSEPCT